MRRFLRELILLILFATPIGYFLSLLKIIQAQDSSAVSIQIDSNRPLSVSIKSFPSSTERLRWITHGTILLLQSIITIISLPKITNQYGIKLIGAYVWLVCLFGIITLISGIFPGMPWNKRPFGISIFEVIFFASLFLVVGFIISH